MPDLNPVSFIEYDGNNSSVVAYVVPFKFFRIEHLEVTVTTAAGVVSHLSPITGFNVTGAGADAGGLLLTVAAVAVSSTIRIDRNTPMENPYEWENGENWEGRTLENNFDWIAMASMDANRRAVDAENRSLRVPAGETLAVLPAAADREGLILGFDGAGERKLYTPAEVAALADDEIEAYAIRAENAADAAEATLILPGPFKNDKEAHANGVVVGGRYLKSDGTRATRVIPTIGYIAAHGSSSFLGSQYLPGANLRQFKGESMIHWALAMLRHPIGYVRHPSGQYHFAGSGSFLETYLLPGNMLDICISRCNETGVACLIVVQTGRNDNAAEDSNTDYIIGMIREQVRRIHAAGHWALIMEDQPRLYDDGSVTLPDERRVLTGRNRINDALGDICADFGCLRAFTRNIGEDPTKPGYVLPGKVDTDRPGHAQVAQATDLGSALYRVLLEQVPFVRAGYNLYDLRAAAINSNWQFAGNAGGGGRPDGWTGSSSTDVAQSFAMVNYDDFATTGRRWARITQTNANLGSEFFTWSYQANIAAGYAQGDILQMVMDARFPDGTGFNIAAVAIEFHWASPYQEASGGMPILPLPSPPIKIVRPRGTVIIRSMPEALPAGVTAINVGIRIYGNGIVDIGSPMILKNLHTTFAPHFPAIP